MREILFGCAAQDLQNDGDASGVIRAEIRIAVTIEDAIAQDGFVAEAGGDTIHMGVE